jgi:hypothetical protein
MAALQPHLSKSFQLSPSASTELLLKPHNITNAAPDGHRFNYLNFSNYLKMHLEFHRQIYDEAIGTSCSSASQAAYDSASNISSRLR